LATLTLELITILIFLFTYLLIVTGRRSRTVAGLIGAFLMIAAGVFASLNDVVAQLNIETLVVLFGIMILVGALREGGFFTYLSIILLRRVGLNPSRVFLVFVILTSVLSALLDSVTVALFMVAVTIRVTELMEVDPKPFIVSEILFANMGGTATSIGDPPNILLGLHFNISTIEFMVNMGPITVTCILVLYFYIRWKYKAYLETTKGEIKKLTLKPEEAITDRKMFLLGAFTFPTFVILMILSRPLNVSPAQVCLGMAAALLFFGGNKITKILENVEWSTLLFFGSIFIVVGGLVETGLLGGLGDLIGAAVGGSAPLAVFVLAWVTALGSAIVDNIPLVVAMLPIIHSLTTVSGISYFPLVWAVSLGTCMGGNATIIASAAGIAGSDMAERQGHRVTFMDFLVIGFTSVLLTVGVGSIILAVRYWLFPF
jgi:Na+/H+ antiporter NhaD/arsenite permease-like protein